MAVLWSLFLVALACSSSNRSFCFTDVRRPSPSWYSIKAGNFGTNFVVVPISCVFNMLPVPSVWIVKTGFHSRTTSELTATYSVNFRLIASQSGTVFRVVGHCDVDSKLLPTELFRWWNIPTLVSSTLIGPARSSSNSLA